jgi:hypothetical protein
MALARKAPSLLALNPDIAVVQECSKNSVDDLHGHGFTGLWFGANLNKGLSVFCSKRLNGSRFKLRTNFSANGWFPFRFTDQWISTYLRSGHVQSGQSVRTIT